MIRQVYRLCKAWQILIAGIIHGGSRFHWGLHIYICPRYVLEIVEVTSNVHSTIIAYPHVGVVCTINCNVSASSLKER